jgi:UrcA family protein
MSLVGGLLLVDAPARAQQVGEITVIAPHAVRQQVGRTPSGVAMEVVSLSRHVRYSDLDLKTTSGKATLGARIADTAQQACSQLDTLYPASMSVPDPADYDCIKSAVRHSMAQAKIVIAAANK